MKVLVFGKNGQLGRELQRSLSAIGDLVLLGRTDVDLNNLFDLRSVIKIHNPDVIVNAAAYTAVDKAELEPEKANQINKAAVGVMAEEAKKLDALFVHYSTDYVFDGSKLEPYLETDQAAPLSVYGQSKIAGENLIRDIGGKYLIFRTSWVYSTHGSNFPLSILRRAIEFDHIDVVADSFGAPTSASLIADVTALVIFRLTSGFMLDESFYGTYNLVASGETSWYEYAKFIIGNARLRGLSVKATPNKVFPVSSEFYKANASRPKNSRLYNKKIIDKFGLTLPDWKVHAAQFIHDIIQPKLL